MSQDFVLDVQVRNDMGKGASRRLRREQNMVPAILYGGNDKPVNLSVNYFKVKKALENEAFYSSIITLKLNGKDETVVLRDIQRHPYKAMLQHMDFLRVNLDQEITMHIPLHFLNQETSPGVKAGGSVIHTISGVEVRCKARHLPEFIEVDLGQLELNDIIHLSDIKLPTHVELNVDLTDEQHNQPVASVHLPRAEKEEEPEEAAPAEGAEAAAEKPEGEKPAE